MAFSIISPGEAGASSSKPGSAERSGPHSATQTPSTMTAAAAAGLRGSQAGASGSQAEASVPQVQIEPGGALDLPMLVRMLAAFGLSLFPARVTLPIHVYCMYRRCRSSPGTRWTVGAARSRSSRGRGPALAGPSRSPWHKQVRRTSVQSQAFPPYPLCSWQHESLCMGLHVATRRAQEQRRSVCALKFPITANSFSTHSHSHRPARGGGIKAPVTAGTPAGCSRGSGRAHRGVPARRVRRDQGGGSCRPAPHHRQALAGRRGRHPRQLRG